MTNNNASRFSAEGNWEAVGAGEQGGLVREVLDMVEAWFLRNPLAPSSHIAIPDGLYDSPIEFSPFAFTSPPTITFVRASAEEGLIDFLGRGQVEGGETLSFLVTLQCDGDDRYTFWSPVSLVP